jgi:MFS transporter, SHS family, lactate transporter
MRQHYPQGSANDRVEGEAKMATWSDLRGMTKAQRNVVVAGFLGWTLDAFDFFVLVFAAKAIAADFQVAREDVVFAVTLTLMARPLGAFVFGALADRYGRRPMLMLDIALFSVFELASAFAPNLAVLFVLRLMFGFAMGGEWGLGSSLTMEMIPPKTRGIVSGLLQEGYSCGNLLAALLFWLLFDHIGWRGMFIVGFLPALLVLYIRASVPESPVWLHTQTRPEHERHPLKAMRGYWGRAVYMIVLMTLFNAFSHGTQDLYPLFLQVEKGFDTDLTGKLATIGPLGAIVGGLFFGALSERIGRKRAIVLATLLSLPILKLWAFSSTPVMLGLGAFWLQVMVQGAWGVVPVHLNELSPDAVRATMPGLTYQIGNFISAGVPWVLTIWAEANGRQYGLTMAMFIAGIAVALALATALGPEARGKAFGAAAQPGAGLAG